MKTIYEASLLHDFYKLDHRPQYPKDSEVIYSTLTPRGTKLPEIREVVVYGIQAAIKKMLIDYFNEHFFGRPREDVMKAYLRIRQFALREKNPDGSHIEALHNLGYLPVRIRALPEGTVVPLRVPVMTIENTNPEFFWVTNWLETLISAETWHPMTVATIAREYRKILNRAAFETVGNNLGVEFQGHDFSMRGMIGVIDPAVSASGHLLSFVGTDTIPAIEAAEYYYGANIENELVGTSIPASEHSVEEAWGLDEKTTVLERLKVYVSGYFSRVSDTWHLWDGITKVLGDPEVKAAIMGREGRMVIRPDSGDPVLILCGDPQASDPRARKGVVELLWDIFGGTLTDKGFKLLDTHIGVIYGDAITRSRAQEICDRLKIKGFASTNVVYGIGSYTYQFNTRDTFGFAIKTTFGQFGGEKRLLFKNPITDDGTKISQKGRVAVRRDEESNQLVYADGFFEDQADDLLQTVFENGVPQNIQTFSQIRGLLASQS